MKTEYKQSFLKDLKDLKSTPSFETIKALAFTEIPNLQKFEDIGNLKKLKGDDNAYRIRIGDYRLGIFFDGELSSLAFYIVKISIAIFPSCDRA